MKISIVTLHYIRNYGSVLQAYATQAKFESLGYEAEIVDYVRPNAEDRAMITKGIRDKNLHGIKKIIYTVLKHYEFKKRNKVCVDFLNKHCTLTRHYDDYEDLKNNPPIADFYCTGSDQTWNSEYNGGILPAYFLEFAPKGKTRIGYSVSIGRSSISDAEKEEMYPLVMKYKAISVRENKAKELLEEIGYENVEHILDPTLVLNKKEWKPLVQRRMIKERYIIIYRLNVCERMEKFAQNLSQKTGCKIIRMSYYITHFAEKGKMIFLPTVEEFLSLIYYADYVITDSFHCTAFSLNFNKNFYVFYPDKYSSRLRSVLELTKTLDRAEPKDAVDVSSINYEVVNRILEKERQKVNGFINNNFVMDDK